RCAGNGRSSCATERRRNHSCRLHHRRYPGARRGQAPRHPDQSRGESHPSCWRAPLREIVFTMPNDPNNSRKLSKAETAIRDVTKQSALAMELPFTIVGAIVLAGFLGYLADKWLHTWPWLTIVGGGLGFATSLLDISRRYRPR